MLRSIAFLVGAILIHTSVCFGQQRVGEAVFFNEKDVVYKIERKYTSTDNTVYYVKHVDDGSFAIKKRQYRRGDTTIVDLDYCDFRIKLNSLQQSGRAGKMLHMRELSFDSMKLWEMRRCYYRNGYPVKMEVFDGHRKLNARMLFNYGKRNVVCKRYRTEKGPSPMPYATDNISWNADTTVIDCHLIYPSLKKDGFKGRFTLKRSTLVSDTGALNTKYAEFEYAEKSSLRNVIIDRGVFDDPPFGMELFLLERERIIRSRYAIGNEIKYEYKIDDKGRPFEMICYANEVQVARNTFRWW